MLPNQTFKNAIVNGLDEDGWIIYNAECHDVETVESQVANAWQEEGVVKVRIELYPNEDGFSDEIDAIVKNGDISDEDISMLASWVEGVSRGECKK